MPDKFRISELPTSASFNNQALVEVSDLVQGVYSSVKKTITELGEKLNNNLEYSAALSTTDKTVIGAINEVNGKGIAGLSDTDITTPTANQVLEYDGSKWANSSVLDNKANTSTFARKSVNTTSAITVSANTIDTLDFTVNDSTYNIVVGFLVSNSTNFAIVQCYFENSTTIRTRVRNLANTSDSYQIKVFYI